MSRFLKLTHCMINVSNIRYILLDKPKRLQDFLKQSIKLGLFIDDKDILLKVSEDGIYTVFESEPYIKPLKNNN